MVWVVNALGRDTGSGYVYTVDAPVDASPMTVEMSAANEHGRRVRAGESPEYLAPPIVAKWVDDVSRETITEA